MATKRPKTQRQSTSRAWPADPATDYARDVVDGRIVAGPHVRAACARHLHDLETAEGRGLWWDVAAVDRAIGFFRDVLRLNSGEFEQQPFILLPWQCFIVGSLFGWKKQNGFRRFRMAFVLTGKGSGKSPLAAGIGLYMLVADQEARAEVYAAAVKKEQAMVLFRDAVAMVDQSPALSLVLKKSGVGEKVWNLAHHKSHSFFRPIATEDSGSGQSGPRPHCGLIDELHEHKTNAAIAYMRNGTKGRRQALIFVITNAAFDSQSVCGEYTEYATKVAARKLQNDSYFSYVCALDRGEDPLKDFTCWIKANPSIGYTIQPEYLEELITEARGMPANEAVLRRVNFCQQVGKSAPWIDEARWLDAEKQPAEFVKRFPASERRKRRCVLGLDLSESKDLSALAAVWPDDERGFDAELKFWTPKENMAAREAKDRAPYSTWVEHGYLEAVDGPTIDYDFVARHVAQLIDECNVVALAFDTYGIGRFRQALDRVGVAHFLHGSDDREDGLRLVRHGQGFGGGASENTLWMEASIKALETAVLKRRARVLWNPVLTYNSSSAVLQTDAHGNRIWSKRKSTGRIDGIPALAMAAGLADVIDSFVGDEPEFRISVLG